MLWKNDAEGMIKRVIGTIHESARLEYEARVVEMDALHDGDHESWFAGAMSSSPYGENQGVRNRRGRGSGGYGGAYFAQYMTSLWENGQVYPVYVPILNRFSALMATLFHRAPSFRGYVAGEELADEDQRLIRSKALLDEVEITTRGKHAQRKAHILGLVFAYPRFYRGKMEIDIVTPDRVRVLEDPLSPGRFADCLAVCQELQGIEDSSRAYEARYLVWTREPQPEGSDVWAVYHTSSTGQVLHNPWFPDNVNPFGRYPHVPMYGTPNQDHIFPVLDDSLHSAQIAANLAWTHIVHGIRRADGTGVLIDPEGIYNEDVQMALGGKVLHLTDGGDFRWAEMKVDLRQLIDSAMSFIKIQAGFRGIPTEMLSIDGPKMIEALSAASKQMDRLDLIELRADQEPLWERQFADLWDSLRRVANHHRPSFQIPDDVTLKVDWNVPEIPQDPQAKAQADAVRLANGTISEVELIAEERNCSREDAEAYRKQIMSDRRLVPDASPDELSTSGDGAAQDTALNGAQIASLLQVINAVALRSLPRASGIAIIMRAFGVSAEQAERLMGDVGKTFFVETPQ